MGTELPLPETRVLAVASHVVSGYVGNKIAVFVMQSLGCDVAALNTVHFSNHTGYKQFKGTKVTAQEISELYQGLKQSYLDDFDMMLSGYIPGAEAVGAVGAIAKDLKARAEKSPGSFFWVLDPVMGDNGRVYVAPDVVPAYRSLVPYADLILPNQFEAELLSDVKITDMASLTEAIQVLHDKYKVPHVVITSVNLPAADQPEAHLSVVGSTMTSTGRARLFKIVFPSIDCYFCGTGDMFGALMVVRMREAVSAVPGLSSRPNWVSPDDVGAVDLPAAKAAEKVLASMHELLERTSQGIKAVVERTKSKMGEASVPAGEEELAKREQLLNSKGAELQLVRNQVCLRAPAMQFKAKAL
ncbi:pyridoxine kinase [Geosmithia morbida]|uniref:pyridoxal kinase n=1 Tax=Geosmithia morbida TaxID=1094350 RepID=A0A9P4YV65_9HYPO|nr:pyridoxine kinase [Geosmithia morbida]KAF4122407.1 pyridoxine kinase [Geosmithia morbida]